MNLLFISVIVLISISKVVSLIGSDSDLLDGIADSALKTLPVKTDNLPLQQVKDPLKIVNGLPVGAVKGVAGNTLNNIPVVGGGKGGPTEESAKAAAPEALGSGDDSESGEGESNDESPADDEEDKADDEVKAEDDDRGEEIPDEANDGDEVAAAPESPGKKAAKPAEEPKTPTEGKSSDSENLLFQTPSPDEKYGFEGGLGALQDKQEDIVKKALCGDNDDCMDNVVKAAPETEKSAKDKLKEVLALRKKYDDAVKEGEREAKKDIETNGKSEFGGLNFPDFDYETIVNKGATDWTKLQNKPVVRAGSKSGSKPVSEQKKGRKDNSKAKG